jgi:hypothetical protein
VRTGDGQLAGRVSAVVDGKPLPGAYVGIPDGPGTRADANGEWSIANAPLGTRVLEVRAVGYYPVRRKVDVIPGAPPVRVALSTLRAMLDTVKITASRLQGRGFDDFAQRRTAGMGKFLSAEEIARRRVLVTSDLFRSMSGVRLVASPDGGRQLLMRGAFAQECSPAIYLDGHYRGGLASDGMSATLSADFIDAWLKPEDVAGIEIYTQGTVPPQFQQGMSDCGSIVIWSK